MKNEIKHIFRSAFDYKNAEKYPEAIAEFKRIISQVGDPEGTGTLMIAMLYYYELNDHEKALPYARQAVDLNPTYEIASLCLVHCLFKAGKQEELQSEIRRYVKTGCKIDFYKTLFEENGVTEADFT